MQIKDKDLHSLYPPAEQTNLVRLAPYEWRGHRLGPTDHSGHPLREGKKTLPGPYGTKMKEVGLAIGVPELEADPARILSDPIRQQTTVALAQLYARKGAGVGTTNTFGARNLINGHAYTYEKVVIMNALASRSGLNRAGVKAPIVASLGPKGDCYKPSEAADRETARDFHAVQAYAVRKAGLDAAWFETINSLQEALGIAEACQKQRVPCVVSFLLGPDGNLKSGTPLLHAIQVIDALTGDYPIGYSLNCCPIEALEPALSGLGSKLDRLIAVYPNASSEDPEALEERESVTKVVNQIRTAQYLVYLSQQYELPIIGGCCGFDEIDVQLISHLLRNQVRHQKLIKPINHTGNHFA